jgi:hypothetical protein
MSEKFPCINSESLKLPRPPARATEAFLSTIAQGMWAEEKLMEAINSTLQFIAVKYGQSRYNHELISGKNAWQKYVTKLYSQMSQYGKRPDILVFRKDNALLNLLSKSKDISEEDEENIKDIVYKSIAGIECRSSSYYYDEYVRARKRSRDDKELSITVKDEDIDRLIKWRKTYCGSKPIYYIQLFFDKGFFISFDKILGFIRRANIERKGIRHYRFERDRKTGKATHFIGMSHAKVCLIAIENPNITTKAIKAWDGKVYAIRTPEGGKFKLSDEFIQELSSLT